MISTSIIFSTGEKKWMPTNLPWSLKLSASEVIGSVEVLDAKITSGFICSCALAKVSALTLRSSNTASMTRSTSFNAA
ncbi:hypothetical protein ACVWW2_001479 [Bradyrhizobium sp. LM4.3]